ncbi:MAG: elongation factor G [bacterium]|nr:elongation factor G [bacterium]
MADIHSIRNFALTGHGDCGKTSIGEAMIYNIGDTTRLGTIEAGNTVLDFQDEEVARKITISTSFYPLAWKKLNLTIIDTPGYADFILETKASLRAADGVVLVVDAMSGVEVMTEKVMEFVDELELPRIIFINKLDRDNADIETALESIRATFGRPLVLNYPIGLAAGFEGIVDLLGGVAYKFPGDGKKPEKVDIPADMVEEIEVARTEMIDNIAETDEALMEKMFSGEELTRSELSGALKQAVLRRDVLPVFCGSATKNIGIQTLMDAVCDLLPSPAEVPPKKGTKPGTDEEIERKPSLDEPFSAYCFKTLVDPHAGRLNIIRVYSGAITSDQQVYNSTLDSKERMSGMFILKGKDRIQVKELSVGMIGAFQKLAATKTNNTVCDQEKPILYKPVEYPQSVFWRAIVPKSRDDEQKMSQGVNRILEEDASFHADRNPETKELVISGMGQAHITVSLEKLKNKFGIEVEQKLPTVAYRETIKGKAEVQGRHKKQTGGAGQFGECWLRLEPQPRGVGFEFVDAIFGGSIPRQFIPAVEKGVLQALVAGPLSGSPVVDVKVSVYDGKYHAVDSKEIAFITAAKKGFKAGFQQATPILMEPIYNIEIKVPEENMGDIMGDLTSKRGRIVGTENKGRYVVVKGTVPMKEILSYSADINSMTGGRGSFEIEFNHYEEVPPDVAKKIIEAYQSGHAAEEDE